LKIGEIAGVLERGAGLIIALNSVVIDSQSFTDLASAEAFFSNNLAYVPRHGAGAKRKRPGKPHPAQTGKTPPRSRDRVPRAFGPTVAFMRQQGNPIETP
jgi:hypothetical protein